MRHGDGENGEIVRAEENELEVAKLLSQVVLAEDVQAVWENATMTWKAKIISIPNKIATQTCTITNKNEIEEITSKLIESTLTKLAIYNTPTKNPKPKKAAGNTKGSTRKAKTTNKSNSK